MTKNEPRVLYDISDSSGLLCTVDAAELKDTKTAHRAAGVKIRIKKRTVFDTITHRQTAIRASRFAYLHRTVESKPAPPKSTATITDVIAPRSEAKGKRAKGRHTQPPLQDNEIAVGAAERAVKIKECKNCATQQTIFSNDFGLPRDFNWRPMSGTGSIHAIQTINGVAVATDGVLVAIRRLDGVIFIGHLDNWVPTPKEPATPAKRQTKRFEKMLEELLA